MKLYIYEHCPFCIRAMMVGNYKGVDYEKVVLLNDDEKSCFDLVGKKQVPILEEDDGTKLLESMDIALRFDQIGDDSIVMRPDSRANEVLLNVLENIKPAISALVYPRVVTHNFPEYETQSSRDYFKNKKEILLGISFDTALAQSEQYIKEVNNALSAVIKVDLPSDHFGQISYEDVLIFPILRNLTLVEGIIFPACVRSYMSEIASITRLSLFN